MSFFRWKNGPWWQATKWCVITFFVLTCHPSFADVLYAPKSGIQVPHITVSGEIKPGDLKHFIQLSQLARNEGMYFVFLDSFGGDVETALSIGRIIRHDNAVATVVAKSQCLSSCVFVLAGGKQRSVSGQVGIHRPFLPVDTKTSTFQQKQSYRKIEKKLKAYLREMNIPTELYDHMIRIPPTKTKFLTADELQRYGLNENDPYWDAASNASFAKRLGISVEEWIRRNTKFNEECHGIGIDKWAECYKRIVIEGR